MVEYTNDLDLIFASLADSTRRDILGSLKFSEQTISEIAARYSMSFAAIAKHIKVLEKANLIIKKKKGRQQMVAANYSSLKAVEDYLKAYEHLWNERLDRLDQILTKEE